MSETFSLDTSGRVGINSDPAQGFIRWSDLDPFTQGYIEALFAELNDRRIRATSDGLDPYGFSDLASEAITLILKDCARIQSGFLQVPGRQYTYDEHTGRGFFRVRQEGIRYGDTFPPLTPFLRDDGKVGLRAA